MSEPAGKSHPSTFQLILVPSIITLAVTLLRLTGELNGWSPLLFESSPGGFGALVGIAWLAPIFGIYFAWKLTAAGQRPQTTYGRTLLYVLLAVLVIPAIGFAGSVLADSVPIEFGLLALSCLISIAIMSRPWPALFRTLLAYGLAARIPVVLIAYFAIMGNWGTHYDAAPPDFPPITPLAKFFWLGLVPQLTLWIAYTLIFGTLFGVVALILFRRKRLPLQAA